MIKTHFISSDNATSFQKSINAFIADKDIIDIKYQSVAYPTQMSGATITRLAINDRVLIIYKE